MQNIIHRIRGNFYFRFLAVVGVATSIMVLSEIVHDTLHEAESEKANHLREARVLSKVVARSLERQVNFLDPEQVAEVLQPIATTNEITKVELFDRPNNLLLDGDPSTPAVKVTNYNDLHHQVIRKRKTMEIVTDNKLQIIEPLVVSDQAVGSVMVEFAVPDYWATLANVLFAKLTSTLPMILVGAALIWSMITRMIRPLRNLVEAARSVEQGNLDIKLEPCEFEDIRKVGEAIESMATTLRGRFEQVYELAYLDRITRLPNREYFLQELRRTLKVAVRKQQTGALLFIDLDGFKAVNDRLGHEYGDRLLKEFGRRVVSVLRADAEVLVEVKPGLSQIVDENKVSDNGVSHSASDEPEGTKNLLARLGGDEFTIILPELDTETDAARVAKRIIDAVGQPFTIDGKYVSIGASIGIATFPHDGTECDVVLKNADVAMYEAKNVGKNTFRFHSDVLNKEASRKVRMEGELRRAIEENELEICYQPRVSVKDRSAQVVEAVLRWNHPEWGRLSEREFITIAHDGGLIYKVDEWVLNKVSEDLRRLCDRGLPVSIAANVAGLQFQSRGFAQSVLSKLKANRVDPEMLLLQVPEKVATQENMQVFETIYKLKQAGVGLVVDGFGADSSSILRLANYSYDSINIDRHLVKSVQENNKGSRQVMMAIVAMARQLGCGVTVKGVRSVVQAEFLNDLQCDWMQGRYISKPLSFEELCDWLQSVKAMDARNLQLELNKKVS